MTAFEVNSSEEDNEINFYHQRSCPSCQRLFYCECDPVKMTLKVLATFSKKQCSIEVDSFVINILNKNGIDSCWLITVKSVQYFNWIVYYSSRKFKVQSGGVCGSVGRAVVFDTIYPQLKSSHRQFFSSQLYWKD